MPNKQIVFEVDVLPSESVTYNLGNSEKKWLINGYTVGSAISKNITDNTSSQNVLPSDSNLITARTLYYAGYTKNTGTITGIWMNGRNMGSSGTINLGNVLTSLPIATRDTAGIVKPGYGLTILNDVIMVESIEDSLIDEMYGNIFPYEEPQAEVISNSTIDDMYSM